MLTLRKLLVAAAFAALVAAAVASAASGSHRAASVATTELMPGVSYMRQVDFTTAGPVVLDVVTMPKPDGTVYSLTPVLSNGTLSGVQKLTGMERSLDKDATTVGIDGDWFNPRSGVPAGMLTQDGVLEHPPAPGRTSLAVGGDGSLQVAPVTFAGTWQGSAGLRSLLLNPASPDGKFALYTPAYGRTTPPDHRVVEVVLYPFPPALPGQRLDGTVSRVTTHGSTTIPPNGAVLVAHGSNRTELRDEARVGLPVEVWLTLSPDWSSVVSAIGGGPQLVADGKPLYPDSEAFNAASLAQPMARGAVGQLADGQIVFVTVEGATPSYSVGISTYDLARELASLGVTTGFGLGAGPAAGIAFDGRLLTRPSGGREAPISDALVLSYSGVYAAPPSVAVLSPNGDGVDDTETLAYRIVRPSRVSARVDGPGGVTVPLAAGKERRGVHQLVWDGTIDGAVAPEGNWTFRVTARDDRGVETTAAQPFSLDDTLSSLSVASGAGGEPVASFTLTRQANVVVRVERPNGISVATVLSATLQPGPQRVRWNGRSGKKPALAGRYRFDVTATSSVGTSSLLAGFSLARH